DREEGEMTTTVSELSPTASETSGMGWFMHDRGRLTWDVHLGLDPGYYKAVQPGPVLEWSEPWLQAVEAALDRFRRTLVLKAAPSFLFPARALDCSTSSGISTCPGISYEVIPWFARHRDPRLKPPVADLERNPTLYWIGIVAELLDNPAKLEKHLN